MRLLRQMTEGVPDHIRSDNGSEFTAKSLREWIASVGVKTAYIEPGLPWEIFYSLKEAQLLIERWRRHYNEVRPQSSLGYRPPAPQVIVPSNKITEYEKI